MRPTRIATLAAIAGTLLLNACADDPTTTALSSSDPAFVASQARVSHAVSKHVVRDVAPFFKAEMAAINERLAAEGANVRVAVADLLLAPDAPISMGTTVYANDRTHRLPYFWVPGDPRRDADGDNLTYLVDESRSYAYTRTSFPRTTYLGDQLKTSFAPWAALACGDLNLIQRPDTGEDPSIVDDGVGAWWLADIVEAGWRDLPPGVLAATYTFMFDDGAGNPTDIDGDGRSDTALAEIWYNLGYYWTTDETPGIDLQSVAIHENGHSLGIGHFGKIFQTNANGKLHFSPRAIMNAAYVEPMRDLKGTDTASFCGNFASWP